MSDMQKLTLYVIAFLAMAMCAAQHYRAHASERGAASVYSSREGKWTASGERMNDHALTAAHRTLPLGTHVRVVRGHRWVVVRINDRGPFRKHRIIDLSPAAARAIGLPGLGNVELSVVD